MAIVVIGLYLGFKREFSKLIGFLVVALIAVGLVFNAAGVKDVLLRAGYELQELPDEVFYKLCDILNLKPGRESLTSYKFLKYVAKRIPARYSKTKIQPHEIAKYKQRNIDDAHKIYFCGWKFYEGSERNAKNFEKTKKWLGDEAYEFCKRNNISSCWTHIDLKRKDYYSPQEYLSQYINNKKDE